ncbi:MAG: hypothetical protein ACRDZN_05970 [Acidimicrobiales bacterium]
MQISTESPEAERGSEAGARAARSGAARAGGMALVAKTVEDTIYTAVGLGVLGFQHLQVQRRELERALSPTLESVEERLSDVVDRARGAR